MIKPIVLAATAALATGCLTDEPDLAHHDDAIVNGQVTSATWPFWEVVYISNHCSGTVIGPRTVLTAAHCFIDNASVTVTGTTHYWQDNWQFDWPTGTWVNLGGYVHDPIAIAGTVVNHPSYITDGVNQVGLDLAIVTLASDARVPPARVQVNPLANNLPITLVGYGAISAAGNGTGTKRYGFNNIDTIASDYFQHTGATGGESTACFNDSGGPALYGHTPNTSGACVVGVINRSNYPSCTSAGGWETRVSTPTAAAWIQSNAVDTLTGC